MTTISENEPRCYRVARLFALLGGLTMFVSAALVSLDVIIRALFRVIPFHSFELTSYAFAIATAFSLGYALLERRHIRIDALYRLFPRGVRIAFDFVNLALMLAVAAGLTYHGAIAALSSWRISSTSQAGLNLPLAVPQGLWALGLGWFAFCAIYLAVCVLRRLAQGRVDEIERSVGIDMTSDAEEI